MDGLTGFEGFQKKAKGAVKGVNSAYKQLNEQQQAQVKILQAQQRASLALTAAEKKEAVEVEKLKIKQQELNRVNKQNAQLSSKLVSEYKKQSIILSRLRVKYKDVALSQGESSKEAQRLLRQVTKLDSKLKRVDKSAGQFGRVVGNYPRQLGAAANSLRSFASAFGFTSAVFILAQTVRNAVKVFGDFDQSQADLAAILGRSTSEITKLKDQALELGATTAFTATQVAALQLELAKLGFNDDQILKATLGIENLAIATGVDAARAAKLGGAALRGFALDASEANRVASVLAVSTTKSASTFSSLEIALPKVSAIAKSFGFTLEDTTALLGGLQNAGFEASVSGTSLRQIFLQLADSNGKLAKRLGGGAKSFDELIEQFKKVESEGISLSEAFNLTNARSVAAFKTFLSGADDLKTLRDSIVDVEAELDTLANQKLDSVQGKVTLLNSAWQGWILNLDSSGDAANALKNSLDFLTKNLNKILNTVVRLGKAFLIYKAILIATSVISKAYVATTTALRVAKIGLALGLNKATIAMKALNLSIKANPIGLLLSGLAAAVALYVAFKDGATEAAEAQRLLNLELEKGAKEIKQSITRNIRLIDDQLGVIDSTVDNEKKATETKLELLNKEIEKRKEANKVYVENSKLRRKSVGDLQAEARNPKSKNKISLNNDTENLQIRSEEIEILENRRRELIKGYDKILKKEQEDKNERSKIAKQLAKDLFELQKSRLKRQIQIADEIQKNEKKSLTERLEANQTFQTKTQELIELEGNRGIVLAKGSANAITKIVEEEEFKKTNALKKGNDERNKIIKNGFDNQFKEFGKLQKARDLSLNEEELALRESLIRKGETTEKIEKKIAEFRSDARKDNLKEQIEYAIFELEVLAITAEQKEAVARALYELRKKLLDLEEKDKDNAAKTDAERLQDREDAIRNAFQGIGDLLGISGDNLATIFNGIENGFEDAGEAARAFGQLVSEVFTSLADAESERIQIQIEALETQKETALKFAGDSAEARVEIEEQFDAKKRQLQERQFKANRKAETIAAVTGTASAVISALGTKPFTPANFALAATVGLLGAAKTAIIASQPIPQFKTGVRGFEGGNAILGDGGVSEYVRTPDGNVFKTPSKDTLYNLPKGTDVFKNKSAFMTELRSMTDFNNIMFEPSLFGNQSLGDININGGGFSKDDYNKGVLELKNTILNQPTSEIFYGENGIDRFIKKGNARTRVLNNVQHIKSRKV